MLYPIERVPGRRAFECQAEALTSKAELKSALTMGMTPMCSKALALLECCRNWGVWIACSTFFESVAPHQHALVWADLC